MSFNDGKTTLDRSGFRPDQEAQIAAQYDSPERPSIKRLARDWHCAQERIKAALVNTGTTIRKRGQHTGPRGGYNPTPAALSALAERHARIVSMRENGASTAEIMDEMGMSRAGVCKVLRQHGYRAPALTSDADIVAAHRAGMSAYAIYRQLHVGYQRIARALAEAGIEVVPATPAAPRPDLTNRNAEILRRRRGGETPRSIAADMGITAAQVYRVLRGAGGVRSA